MIPVAFTIRDLNVGGAQRQLLYLVREIDRTRFAPVVITLKSGGDLVAEFHEGGVEVIELGYRGRWDVGVISRISRTLRERGIAVVCLFWPADPLVYAALRRAGIRRWIASERSSGTAHVPVLRRVLERHVRRRAPVVLVISEAGREFVRRMGVLPERIAIVPIGVPEPGAGQDAGMFRREVGIGAQDLVVGTLASFLPNKDHVTLLQAAAIVLRRLPHTRFVLAGDGPLRPESQRLAAELGIADHVMFPGLRADRANWLNLLDVALLATRDREGSSNFLVEAALCAKPAVATRVGGIPEVVREGQTGYLVPPRDARAMAQAAVALLENAPLRRSMGQAAAHWARQRFSLGQMVHGWQEVLAGLNA